MGLVSGLIPGMDTQFLRKEHGGSLWDVGQKDVSVLVCVCLYALCDCMTVCIAVFVEKTSCHLQ